MSIRARCEDVRESLSPLIDDELSEGRRKVVSAHLLTCDECSELAGRLVAARGVVRRDDPQAEAPASFMARLQERLDEVDGVEGVRTRIRRPGRTRRVTAIAAAGAIAVSIAIILSTVFFIDNDQAFELAQMHQQITALPGPVPGGGFSMVSCDPARDNWRQAHQTLVTVDGVLVTYTLYNVGTCPVSVYSGPTSWEPYRTGWLVTERINGFDVREVGDLSMTSWTRDGLHFVLIASLSPEDVAALARTHISSLGRSPAY